MTKTATKPKKKSAKATKAKAPKVKSPIPPGLALEALQRIAGAERQFDSAVSEMNFKKEAYKTAKSNVERLRTKLHVCIREETGNEPSLFTGVKEKKGKKGAAATAEPSTNGYTTSDVQLVDGKEDESWRHVKMTALGIAPGLCKALAKEGIATVGEYADWMKPGADGKEKWLTNIKGIGEGAVTKIEDAVENFFREHNAKLERQKQMASEVVNKVADSTELPSNDSANHKDTKDDQRKVRGRRQSKGRGNRNTN